MGHALDTVNRFYNAVRNGGSGLASLIATDISFVGPMAQFSGAEAFEAGMKEMAPALRGIEIVRQFEDGDEVCSVIELQLRTPGGELRVPATEWMQVADGRIARSRLYYDARELAAALG